MDKQNPRASLPAELWYRIIYMLPSLDQETCLSVSKTFHDIATTYVFSHVTICLGLWQPFEFEREDDDLGTEEKAAMKRQANVSYDILRHIMHTPDFAKKVKKISVRAFSNAGEEMQIAIRFLADALQALPELRAFVWYGIGPIVSTDIIKVLASFANSTLQEFCIPPELPEGSETLLPSFTHLRSFSTMDMRDSVFDVKDCTTIRATIQANAHTLRSVRLTGNIWAQLPPLSRFAHLEELELIYIAGYDELATLFAHFPRLCAFTLLYAEPAELIPILHAHPHALPNLESFKLWGTDYDEDAVGVLAEFLRSKRRLRRLEVMIHTYPPRTMPEGLAHVQLLPLLQIMPALPDLHIVGLSLRVQSVEEDHIRDLQAYLPRSLSALLIWTDIDSATMPAKHWTDLFAAYPLLRYLHIIPDYYDVLDLQEDISREPPPNLELFGYAAQIHPMTRDPATGAHRLCPRWPYPKMRFRTADDYGDEDWEWLLRHHGHEDDEDGLTFMQNAYALC